MAKGKPNGSVQNRAIYSRVSFLHQAAAAIAVPGTTTATAAATAAAEVTFASHSSAKPAALPLEGMARRLATDLRSVSLKTRIRLSPNMKQTLCKFCDSILIEGQSVTSTVENRSRGGRKSWADVLVRKCHACGRERRYPVSAARPKRKGERGEAVGAESGVKERAEAG
ncbi:RNAse P Rpr2/Rpp21/SNM1 subunit domain-containing protein [Lasiosphaeria hispida]|uniref:RNAse P Rpr2/Rpp21/SNM1 subunit domain-containing protein n=1 Tax=Lasiosphaeria hispida TaxID=260671 RepID=A0AAJ0MK70_9PEZI|nr:RNAse P Rpr2/Rpp21/SNM1 subunit domain-containing protein [Lasiosphaeria hispida]